jgi:hypothetical protein
MAVESACMEARNANTEGMPFMKVQMKSCLSINELVGSADNGADLLPEKCLWPCLMHAWSDGAP